MVLTSENRTDVKRELLKLKAGGYIVFAPYEEQKFNKLREYLNSLIGHMKRNGSGAFSIHVNRPAQEIIIRSVGE